MDTHRSSTTKIPYGEIGIIVLPSCTELGAKTDKALLGRRRVAYEQTHDEYCFQPARTTYIVPVATPRFTNGESKAELPRSVRGMDLYILADVGNYSVTYEMFGRAVPMGPDEHFQDIKRVISAIGGKARRISVIMPFLYGGRQHKRKSRESLDAAMALQELAHLGVSSVCTFDAHDQRVQNAVPLIGFENLYPTYYFVRALVENEDDVRIDKTSMIVVAPDTGAMDKAIYYASVLQLDVGLFYKRRDLSRTVSGRNPIVQHEYMGTDVGGKDVLVVEDIIATGDSMLHIVDELKARGARSVYIAATFALFTEGVSKFTDYYERGLLKRVYSANVTYLHRDLSGADWHVNVDMSPLLAALIDKSNYDESISTLFDATAKIREFLASQEKTNGRTD